MFSKLTQYLKKETVSPKIIVFAGAGLSAESGLATFRDTQTGLWNKHNINDVCDFRTWSNNKNLIYKFYNKIKEEILAAEPNPAHLNLAQLQTDLGTENVYIFTSNIDNLLERAGANVTHIHGDIYHSQCVECNSIWYIGYNNFDYHKECPKCFSTEIKPNIVFFHEQAPKYKEMKQAFESGGVIKKKALVPNIRLIIGTSFNVLPLDFFCLNRGINFLVDTNPQIKEKTDLFQEILQESASTGTIKATESIKKLYVNL